MSEDRGESSSHRKAKRKKDIYLESRMKNALTEDPRLERDSDLTVDVEYLGLFKGSRAHILGKVHTEEERTTAEKLLQAIADKHTEISNELIVQ